MDENENRDTLAAILSRDPTVSLLFAAAFLLIVLNGAAAILVAHTRHFELVMVPLLLTGAFAIVGMVVGLVRSLKSARAHTRRSA